MLRHVLIVLVVALAAVPVAAAKADLCQKYGTCPVVVVTEDRVCGGWVFGFQGVVACAYPQQGCARVHYGFHSDEVCVTAAVSPVLP